VHGVLFWLKTFINAPVLLVDMRRGWVGLVGIFAVVLAVRLFFAFQTPFLSSDNSYLHVRAVESLAQGKLLLNDPLGYGGRDLVGSPLFDAILALFSLVLPFSVVFKVIPNIFASLLVIPAFFLCFELTKNRNLSLFAAFLTSIVPVFLGNTFNQVTPLSLALPLFFFLTYFWVKSPKQGVLPFIALLVFFVFLHPLSLVFMLSLVMYFVLAFLDKLSLNPGEYELGVFAIFFSLWAQFLLYKKVILFHGPGVIYQNIPDALLSSFYAKITVLQAIVQVGAYPLAEGVYALYKTAFKSPQKEINILLSITIVSAVLLWLKLIALSLGLMLLGIALAILFSKWSAMFFHYVKQTKFARFGPYLITGSLALAFISTAIPAYFAVHAQLVQTISPTEVEGLRFLGESLPLGATIIAPPSYGHYVTEFAKRRTVIDDYFLLQPRINERYQDVSRVYKGSFETEAVALFDKYNATHIVIPPGTQDVRYGNESCFKVVYDTGIKVYQKRPFCSVKVVA